MLHITGCLEVALAGTDNRATARCCWRRCGPRSPFSRCLGTSSTRSSTQSIPSWPLWLTVCWTSTSCCRPENTRSGKRMYRRQESSYRTKVASYPPGTVFIYLNIHQVQCLQTSVSMRYHIYRPECPPATRVKFYRSLVTTMSFCSGQ